MTDDHGADVNTWVNVVRRARLHPTTKLIALFLASYANGDGTQIYPGVALLAVQSRHGYRTVQAELKRLRDLGLIEPMPRTGMPRTSPTRYRLILAADVLELVDVPTPAAEKAAAEKLIIRYRGRHRPKKTARSPDGAQTGDCTQWGDTTARNGQSPDQQECTAPSIDPPYTGDPPGANAAPGTDDAAGEGAGFPFNPYLRGGNPVQVRARGRETQDSPKKKDQDPQWLEFLAARARGDLP